MNKNKNKNKNISNSYKDYKYVYTGLDDYLKSHHLDKKEIKEEKEKIVHDHRNVFDFNNPNQHHHDYSFDFNQNPEPPKKSTTYKDKYGNTYNRKPTITTRQTSNNYSNPNYNYNQTTTTYKYNNNDKNAKMVRNVILIIFFAPFIFAILSGIISIFSVFNDMSDYEYEEIQEEDDISYLDPINALCNGVEYSSYSYVLDYILPEETQYNNGDTWRKIVYTYDQYGNSIYSGQRTCTIKSSYHPVSSGLIEIEEQYQNKYNTTELIEDGYKSEIIITNENNYETKNYIVTTIKLNGSWYLFEII